MKIKRFLWKTGIIISILFGLIFYISCNSLDFKTIHIVRPLEQSPKLNDIQVKSATEIVCVFSKSVKVLSLYAKSVTDDDVVQCEGECDEEGILSIHLPFATQIGKEYTMCGVVENEGKSSLSFEFEFMGMNDHRADLVLSEIHDGYSGKTQECEFIEVYAVTDGNTAGYEIYSAYDGEAKNYVFPAMEVKAGEYITVHLRKLDESCTDEIGDNVKLNENIKNTCRTARDLFALDSIAHLGGVYDVILLRDKETQSVRDAICYVQKSKNDSVGWKKLSCSIAAEQAVEAGVWTGEDIEDALNADGLTITHTLARQNIKSLKNYSFPYPNGAKYWIVTENRKAITPGKPNSSSAKK